MSNIFIFSMGIGAGMVILAVILFLMLLTGKLEVFTSVIEWEKAMVDCDDAFRKSDEQIAAEEYCVHYSDTGKHEFDDNGVCSCGTTRETRFKMEGVHEPTNPPANPVPPSEREGREYFESLTRLLKVVVDGNPTVEEATKGLEDCKKTRISWGMIFCTSDNLTKKWVRNHARKKIDEWESNRFVEGTVKKGGLNTKPTKPRPDVVPVAQNPAPPCTQDHQELRDLSGSTCTECGVDLYAPEETGVKSL